MEAKISLETGEKSNIHGTENDVLYHQNSRDSTEKNIIQIRSCPSTSRPETQNTIVSESLEQLESSFAKTPIDSGSSNVMEVKQIVKNDKDLKNNIAAATEVINNAPDNVKNDIKNAIIKNKRKRRRGKSKSMGNNSKPYSRKSNWKFQAPSDSNGRYRSNRCNNARDKFLRSRSIVPYNTNRFLMEDHLAELPSALLTPSGRTRDSSFSVDSEDNYFYSLPEDEEEFLTKEFVNVYEKARRERLESMTKQQLIDECLQLEERYNTCMQANEQKNINIDCMNKIKILEDKVRDLTADNLDLRRKLGHANEKIPPEDRMCSSSEDSESDSSTSSSSSSSSKSSCDSEYSPHSSSSRMEMDSDDIMQNNCENNGNITTENSNMSQEEEEDNDVENGQVKAKTNGNLNHQASSSTENLSSDSSHLLQQQQDEHRQQEPDQEQPQQQEQEEPQLPDAVSPGRYSSPQNQTFKPKINNVHLNM